ncbi:MAG: HDOD domain-containing protein [Planctomycetota bacterium]|jgi:putative nucleotidyltransferase with HDIG domain
MPLEDADPQDANELELVIHTLDSLSILPSVAARVLSQLTQSQTTPSMLAEIVESDPALTARVFSLMHSQGLSGWDRKPSVRRMIEKLPAGVVRDTFVSVKVLGLFNHVSQNSRVGLLLHSLAVACCTREIAANLPVQITPELAYLAGLLHDLGKLALEQELPKSFERMAEQAKSQNCSSCIVEQRHLGLDHTTLGRQLGRQWHLPEAVTVAIWLHHSDTVAISKNLPEARIAQIVRLADCIARQCGIGQSGSYDPPDVAEQIVESLAISSEQLLQIREKLPEAVEAKAGLLGLDSANGAATYCRTLQSAAGQFARDNSKLTGDNRRLQSASSHLDFIKGFLLSIDSSSLPIDIARKFAVRWQKFYQTGMVCLYLLPKAGANILEAVVVESLAKSRVALLDSAAQVVLIPEALTNEFSIADAGQEMDWLFGQLDVDFDLSQTKVLALRAGPKVIGAIAFELRYPGDVGLFREDFKLVTSIAGVVLDMALNCASQERFAEQFSQLLSASDRTVQPAAIESPPEQISAEITAESPLTALAEMAGGAAHELNNPLSVISGRAQLLAEAETDPEKKRMLDQIRENSGEITAIINDLMTFAEPPAPRPAATGIKQILDEAILLTSLKTKAEHVNVQAEVDEGVGEVFVDSGQIVSAVANIVCNSLESYAGKMGPIKITADRQASGAFVQLQISDLGRGMDTETVRKATQPFFSGQPAGRKRGMGLAHAQRLIELNHGSTTIESEPGSGTTVTILLPCK